MTACTQPGCTGMIIDEYCDVCGSPAGAVPFVPAAVSAASPAPADEPGPTAVRGESGFPAKPKSGSPVTACTQPGCTGMIIDDYCDVCGSPAGAVPFVPAAVSAAPPAPTDEPGLTAVPAPTPAPGPIDEEMPTQRIPRLIDVEGSREVEATLRRLIEPAAADLEEGDTAEVADFERADTAPAGAGLPVTHQDRPVQPVHGLCRAWAARSLPASRARPRLRPDVQTFCGGDQLTAPGCQPPRPGHRLSPGEHDDVVQVAVSGCIVGATTSQSQSSMVNWAVNRPTRKPRLGESGATGLTLNTAVFPSLRVTVT